MNFYHRSKEAASSAANELAKDPRVAKTAVQAFLATCACRRDWKESDR